MKITSWRGAVPGAQRHLIKLGQTNIGSESHARAGCQLLVGTSLD